MNALESLFSRFAHQCDGRWWVGARPDGPDREIPALIATDVGYPTGGSDPFEIGAMVDLTRAEAAHVLAVAGTCSLAYGDATPRTSAIREAALAVAGLGDEAMFLSNGRWRPGGVHGWMALSAAAFDCGVIGFDAAVAFIFWVEEED